MNDDYECPYCGEEIEYNGDGCDSGEQLEEECPKCEKIFMLSVEYYPSYSTEKAPCLNDGKHNWEQLVGVPKEYFEKRERCNICNKERIRE